jgi:hypothetical protein
MKKTCLGFPIWKARGNHKVAKSIFRKIRIPGFQNFKLKDYDTYNFRVGDLANDCDGINHRIAKIVPYYTDMQLYGCRRGKVLTDIIFYKEDGTAFCHACRALTKQEIVEWFEHMKANRIKDDWNFMGDYEELYGKDFTINDDGTITRRN